jgi:hypothetical protein
MKKLLTIILTTLTLTAYAAHGDSLTSFNNVTVYDNNINISRHGGTSYECYEYVTRYYKQVYNINLYDFIRPSISINDANIYFAADMIYNLARNNFVYSPNTNELMIGDIIVYGRTESSFTGHCAIYIGDGMEIGQNIKPVISDVGEYIGILRLIE